MDGETALVQSQSAAVEVLDVGGKLSPDIIARAAAIYGSVGPVRQEDGKQVGITKAEALRAALYLADNPGETLGRDVYLSTQGKTRGQLMEGYRAVQDRITQRFGVKYRMLTPEELEMHDVPKGKKSLIAEVTVYADKIAADAAGVEYQPIIGITVQDPPTRLPEGKTLRWVLEKNARKDALRQMVGMPVDADEAIADLDTAGVDVSELRQLRAEGKHFTAEQAAEMVEQNQRAEVTTANFRAMTPEEQQTTLKRNTDAMRAPAGFEGFGDEPEKGAPKMPRESHGPNWEATAWQIVEEARERPYSAIFVRDILLPTLAAHYDPKAANAAEVPKGGFMALKNLFGTNNEDNQRAAVAYLFGHDSRRDVSAAQWYALIKWCDSKKMGGEWVPSAHALDEAKAVLVAAMPEAAQAELLPEESAA